MSFTNRPTPSGRPTPLHPRRVRGGVRLTQGDAPGFSASWAARRWVRLMEGFASGTPATEGLRYAALGQVRQIGFEPGCVRAIVQGRQPRAYDTVLAVAPFPDDRWEAAIVAMLDQAVYSAKLLSGELPETIEELFGSLGLHLFPRAEDRGTVSVSCACADWRADPARWCKHACCVGYLVADRLAVDPFLIFTLRGLARDDLLERLRQRRHMTSARPGGTLVYAPHVPGLTDAPPAPLEASLDRFWDAPPTPAPDLPIAPPEVSHPLLRRLGPSPFTAGPGLGKFPLVGLLATCYEVISDRVIRAERDEVAPGWGAADAGPPAVRED
jgi:uncharacterized Zn finger protein